MSLLALSELSFEYLSGPVLFENVSFSVNPADRVAFHTIGGRPARVMRQTVRQLIGRRSPQGNRQPSRKPAAASPNRARPGPRSTVNTTQFRT